VKSFFQRFADRTELFCRRHPWSAAAFILIFIVVVILLRASILRYQNYFGMYHDDGVYLVSAQSLSENHGYRIASLPGQPHQTKYPIGYPFLLSLALRLMPVFPANLPALEAMQVALSVAAILGMVSYLEATKKVTILLGLTIAAACLLNMRFIDFAPMLMSDLPSAVLLAACMWSAEKQLRTKDSFKPWAGLLMAAAVTVRTQAIVLAPALFCFYVFRKRWKTLIATFIVAFLFIAPQIWWQSHYSNSSPDFITFYTNYLKHAYITAPSLDASYQAMLGNFNWSVVLQINTYFPGLEQISYQLLSPIAFFLIYTLGYGLLVLPSSIGVLVKIRQASLPALFCFFYAALLCCWPSKLEWRHILPVMVLGYYFYFVGFRFLASQIKRIAHTGRFFAGFCRVVSVTFCCYLICGAGLLSCSKAGWMKSIAVPPPPVTATDFQQAVSWVKENTPANSVFVCNNDPVFYLYTRRHAIMPSRLEVWRFTTDQYVDPKSLLEAIEYSHATYVMNEPAFRSMGYSYTQLAQSIEALNRKTPGFLVPVFESANKLVTVYKIEKSILKP
jgi:hypothetical protein